MLTNYPAQEPRHPPRPEGRQRPADAAGRRQAGRLRSVRQAEGGQPAAGHLHRHPLLDGARGGGLRDLQGRTLRQQGE